MRAVFDWAARMLRVADIKRPFDARNKVRLQRAYDWQHAEIARGQTIETSVPDEVSQAVVVEERKRDAAVRDYAGKEAAEIEAEHRSLIVDVETTLRAAAVAMEALATFETQQGRFYSASGLPARPRVADPNIISGFVAENWAHRAHRALTPPAPPRRTEPTRLDLTIA